MIAENALVQRYHQAGWWDDTTLSELVGGHAAARGDQPAYIEPDRLTTWAGYDRLGNEIASVLISAGVPEGDRVALLLPDTVEFHAALLGTERAGVVAVGIGSRAGEVEIAHLLKQTGARTIITMSEHRGQDMSTFPHSLRRHGIDLAQHVVLTRGSKPILHDPATGERSEPGDIEADRGRLRPLGADALWALNSTSGTTGLPKCVTQNQNRWKYFSRLAIESGGLTSDDVFLGAVPAPFGFGLWTAHFCPTILGVPTVVMEKFDVDTMIRLIEQQHVTVLAAVSTQFRMLLNSPLAEQSDLSTLRVMYTGGEAIPFDAAAEFERRVGATVLNFFGSNETGAFSYTTSADSPEHRLRTGGRVIPEMDVRLYNDDGQDVTATGGPGQPGGLGPLLCGGYYADKEANQQLYTSDGHMLMGDLVTIDEHGFLRVVGRKSDLIIRGGKNISAVEVEDAVDAHPAVELASVVAVPDRTYGERACAVVTVRAGATLSLDDLRAHMIAEGLSKELIPEYLVLVDELPRSSGGKIAKASVREIALAQLPGLAVQDDAAASSSRS